VLGNIVAARPPTDRVLLNARTTHLATEALLWATSLEHPPATKTLVITVFGENSKRFGFNVASGVQCGIPINCAIQILLLN